MCLYAPQQHNDLKTAPQQQNNPSAVEPCCVSRSGLAAADWICVNQRLPPPCITMAAAMLLASPHDSSGSNVLKPQRNNPFVCNRAARRRCNPNERMEPKPALLLLPVHKGNAGSGTHSQRSETRLQLPPQAMPHARAGVACAQEAGVPQVESAMGSSLIQNSIQAPRPSRCPHQ